MEDSFYRHEESILALISIVKRHGRKGLKKVLERSGKTYNDVKSLIKGVRKDRRRK